MTEPLHTSPDLDRRAVVRELLNERRDMLVVSGLGGTSWDVAAVGDNARNFYLWGGMGCAVPLGLGLALAQPDRRVMVVTGDGEMLMGIGSLATVAVQQPNNLAIVVIDNERYGETGGQLTHSAFGTDLALMARGAGLIRARTLSTLVDLRSFCQQCQVLDAPLFAVVKVATENASMVLPPRDGVLLKHRFREALLQSPT